MQDIFGSAFRAGTVGACVAAKTAYGFVKGYSTTTEVYRDAQKLGVWHGALESSGRLDSLPRRIVVILTAWMFVTLRLYPADDVTAEVALYPFYFRDIDECPSAMFGTR